MLIVDELTKRMKIKLEKGKRIERKYKIINEKRLALIKKSLKQHIQIKVQRIRMYCMKKVNSVDRIKYFICAKKFYREIGEQPIEINYSANTNEVFKFWKNIWNNSKKLFEEAS